MGVQDFGMGVQDQVLEFSISHSCVVLLLGTLVQY